MPYRSLSFADVPTTAHVHVGDTAIHQKKNMKQDILNMTGNVQAKSSTRMWSWAILAVFALAIVAIIFGGLDVLPPSIRAGITDYIVAIGASELPVSADTDLTRSARNQ